MSVLESYHERLLAQPLDLSLAAEMSKQSMGMWRRVSKLCNFDESVAPLADEGEAANAAFIASLCTEFGSTVSLSQLSAEHRRYLHSEEGIGWRRGFGIVIARQFFEEMKGQVEFHAALDKEVPPEDKWWESVPGAVDVPEGYVPDEAADREDTLVRYIGEYVEQIILSLRD